MSIKFDGTNIKRGSSTVANLRSDELREGTSSAGKVLGNIKRGDEIREGSLQQEKYYIKDGRYIREGSSSAGDNLLKYKMLQRQ